MELLDRLIEGLTNDDGRNDSHFRKYPRLWMTLFFIVGALILIAAFYFAGLQTANPFLGIILMLFFGVMGMALILSARQIYANHVRRQPNQ